MGHSTNDKGSNSKGFEGTKPESRTTETAAFDRTKKEGTGFNPKDSGVTTDFIENWSEQKLKLKQKFSNLTDSDLQFAPGKQDEMFGKLQTKLGKSREELNAVLKTA
jgi:uncharacterized protein YjbJ (UPF0337 family)